MEPHYFEEAGVAYEVQFHLMRGRWMASLRGQRDERPVLLHPLPGESAGPMSDEARRAGFIAVANWLVKTGRHAARVAGVDRGSPGRPAGPRLEQQVVNAAAR